MSKVKKAELITGMDLAKKLGVVDEYNNALLEQELNEQIEDFVKSDIEEMDNSINNQNKNG